MDGAVGGASRGAGNSAKRMASLAQIVNPEGVVCATRLVLGESGHQRTPRRSKGDAATYQPQGRYIWNCRSKLHIGSRSNSSNSISMEHAGGWRSRRMASSASGHAPSAALVLVLMVLGCCCLSCRALVELPERARGGTAWKLQQERLHGGRLRGGLRDESFNASTWPAQVDNFDASAGTFKQRYYVDDRYYDEKQGIVFLMIGGEGTLTGPPGGYIRDLGEKYGALLVSLEHRFYGESLPNNDMSTENYRYLTVEQALADLERFSRTHLKPSLLGLQGGDAGRVRIFAFGGSYPGALAAWYRVLYPQATVGSLSSSGVVNAILDFPEFDQQVATAIGQPCADMLRKTTAAFEALLPYKGEEVKGLFGVDAGMWDPDFYYMLADSAAMADQYGHKETLCTALLQAHSSSTSSQGEGGAEMVLVRGFANFTNSYYGPQFGSSCFYDSRCLADLDKATLNERSWRWQKCSQLAYFQVAPATGSLRSRQVDLSYTMEQCQRVFGSAHAVPSVLAINARFGGQAPSTWRVFFTDFSDDPWQQASVRQELAADDLPYELVTCDGCGHCMDLHTPLPNDPSALLAARDRFETYLAQWLMEAKQQQEDGYNTAA